MNWYCIYSVVASGNFRYDMIIYSESVEGLRKLGEMEMYGSRQMVSNEADMVSGNARMVRSHSKIKSTIREPVSKHDENNKEFLTILNNQTRPAI